MNKKTRISLAGEAKKKRAEKNRKKTEDERKSIWRGNFFTHRK
jgi:hypothetical protein